MAEKKKTEAKPAAPAFAHVGIRRAPRSGYEVWLVTSQDGKLEEQRLSPCGEPLVAARQRARVELGRRMP